MGSRAAWCPPATSAHSERILARLAIDDSWRAELGAAARRRAETLPTWADAATAFFGAIRGMSAGPG